MLMENVLSGPSRIFGALLTGFTGLFVAALLFVIPAWGHWLALVMFVVAVCMTVRVGCMAVVLRPDTLHVRAAYALSRNYQRSEISEITIVPTGNWGGTGVCLGLTLTSGRSVRIKAVNGYRGSRAVDRALGEARDWLATSTP